MVAKCGLWFWYQIGEIWDGLVLHSLSWRGRSTDRLFVVVPLLSIVYSEFFNVTHAIITTWSEWEGGKVCSSPPLASREPKQIIYSHVHTVQHSRLHMYTATSVHLKNLLILDFERLYRWGVTYQWNHETLSVCYFYWFFWP